MIIAATGHRPNKLGGYGFEIQQRLIEVARDYLTFESALAPHGLEVIIGMALGWDQAFAFAAYDLKIPYIAAVPFHGQEKLWPEQARATYRKLLDRAAHVHIICDGDFEPWKMQRRNEWMVDNSDRLCALWNGTGGGTANCVRYAEDAFIPIDNVWREFVA